MRRKLTGRIVFVFMALFALLGNSLPVCAELQSPNYHFDESVIGGSGLNQSSSANYQGRDAVGDLGIGNSASANYQINAGSQTTNDPALSFSVLSGSVSLGSFSPSNATMSTGSFSVSNYTSYGYVVQIVGTPPTNGGHVITPLANSGSSITGVEQFGINLVANTVPASMGANPDQGQFGFGLAATNYNTPNTYRYVSGETIASAPKSSGVTVFTISYLVNVSSLTPGGQYTSDQTIIVTGTY